jgi:hypothetical protein
MHARSSRNTLGRVARGRRGAAPVECHFGIVRSVLSDDDRWSRWLSAEVQAELIKEFLADLELPEHRRRTRASNAGVDAAPRAAEDRATLVHSPRSLEEVADLAWSWGSLSPAALARVSEEEPRLFGPQRPRIFEKWLRALSTAIDAASERTRGVAQGDLAGGVHLTRCINRGPA